MDEHLDIEDQYPMTMKNEDDQFINDTVEDLLVKIVDVVCGDIFPIAETVLHSSETSNKTKQNARPIEDPAPVTVEHNHGATPVICLIPRGLIATSYSGVKRWTCQLLCGCCHVGEGVVHE